MSRVAIKITGAQGQGVNSVGEICAKGLKRTGYSVFGYREYMSLIKGGHSSYQLDIGNEEVRSSTEKVHILVCFNHHGLELNLKDVVDGGIVIHQTPDWTFSAEQEADMKKRKIVVIELTTDKILAELKAKPILGNMLVTSVVWALLRQSEAQLEELAHEQFGHKKDLMESNLRCIKRGFQFKEEFAKDAFIDLPTPNAFWKDHMLLTGSQAMGMGIVHAGVRLFAGYPMTPSSPLLSYISEKQNETGMVIKQAEDEITAIQVASGAMHMGTRAMTATSGGGFDLMTETLSLNGIIENPCVVVLAQRPGPATGLPTWTAQGDLFLAVFGGHGEFPRCVISVSDSQDCFDLMPEAFNLAEEYQTVVIVLTDKQIAEALYTQKLYDQTKAELRRGNLVTDPKKLAKLTSSDRFDPKAKDGISPRWLPGSHAAVYVAQGDEHRADGSVDETADNAHAQMEKRMKKAVAMKAVLPQPELWMAGKDGKAVLAEKDPKSLDLLLVGWGSTKGPMLDVLEDESMKGKSVGYLHYTYLWPLHTERLQKLKTKKTVLVEGNNQSQLGMMIRQECGMEIPDRILKFDGRPFFFGELLASVSTYA